MNIMRVAILLFVICWSVISHGQDDRARFVPPDEIVWLKDATEKDVQYFVGDWTNEDPEITKFLTRYGRSGVPLYVYYGAPSADTGERPDPEVLPQVLTPALIKKTFVQ